MLKRQNNSHEVGAACDSLITTMSMLVLFDNAVAQYDPYRIDNPLEALGHNAYKDTVDLLEGVHTPDITPDLLIEVEEVLRVKLANSAAEILSRTVLERLIRSRRDSLAKKAELNASNIREFRIIPHNDNIALIGGMALSEYGQSLQPEPVIAGEAIDVQIRKDNKVYPYYMEGTKRYNGFTGYSINGYPVRSRKRARYIHFFSLVDSSGNPQVDLLPLK